DHQNSNLELVATARRSVLEIEYRKERGKESKPNDEIILQECSAIKGISALGNKLPTESVNQLGLLDHLPVEEVEDVSRENEGESDEENSFDKQGNLFDN